MRYKEYLKTIYEFPPEFHLTIFPFVKLQNQINGKVPDFIQVLKEANQEIGYGIDVFTTDESNELTLFQHTDKILKLIDFEKVILPSF